MCCIKFIYIYIPGTFFSIAIASQCSYNLILLPFKVADFRKQVWICSYTGAKQQVLVSFIPAESGATWGTRSIEHRQGAEPQPLPATGQAALQGLVSASNDVKHRIMIRGAVKPKESLKKLFCYFCTASP